MLLSTLPLLELICLIAQPSTSLTSPNAPFPRNTPFLNLYDIDLLVLHIYDIVGIVSMTNCGFCNGTFKDSFSSFNKGEKFLFL